MALGIKHCPPPKGGPGAPGEKPKPSNAGMKGSSDAAKKHLSNLMTSIKGSGPLPQLLLGSGAGWMSGSMAMRMGRIAAAVAGVSIIGLQVAHHQGYSAQDWRHVTRTVSSAQKKLAETDPVPKVQQSVTNFANTNGYFAAGFVGGFLIGLAS